MDNQDPRRLLASRLRDLRKSRKITQPQLASALGGSRPLSVPLISSWESQSNPRIPPYPRLEGYAALFASARSFQDGQPRLLPPEEMSDGEQRIMSELKQELTRLRNDALRVTTAAAGSRPSGQRIQDSLDTGPLRYADGNQITIVCAPWPRHMLSRMPYTDMRDPDFIELLTYSDLDALFELHGHIRAANPVNQVHRRIAGKLEPDDYSSHLISLGGVDWNTATSQALRRLQLPVRQVADWDIDGGQYFEVEEGGKKIPHHPVLEDVPALDDANSPGGRDPDGPGNRTETDGAAAAKPMRILREDVALFARAVSPFNSRRTVTICNGMYGRGTYGVVRALTDAVFRESNAEYLRTRFGSSEAYCILTRVPIVEGATLTPDWAAGDYTLFEWSG